MPALCQFKEKMHRGGIKKLYINDLCLKWDIQAGPFSSYILGPFYNVEFNLQLIVVVLWRLNIVEECDF
jgi:hypothetical protein